VEKQQVLVRNWVGERIGFEKVQAPQPAALAAIEAPA